MNLLETINSQRNEEAKTKRLNSIDKSPNSSPHKVQQLYEENNRLRHIIDEQQTTIAKQAELINLSNVNRVQRAEAKANSENKKNAKTRKQYYELLEAHCCCKKALLAIIGYCSYNSYIMDNISSWLNRIYQISSGVLPAVLTKLLFALISSATLFFITLFCILFTLKMFCSAWNRQNKHHLISVFYYIIVCAIIINNSVPHNTVIWLVAITIVIWFIFAFQQYHGSKDIKMDEQDRMD